MFRSWWLSILLVPALAAAADADLSLSVTGPESAIHGQPAVYELRIRNNGPDPATEVSLFYNFSASLPLEIVGSDAACAGENVIPTGTCALGSMAVGSERDVRLIVPATNSEAAMGAVFSIQSVETDPVPSSNYVLLQTPLVPALAGDLMVKAEAPAPSVPPGSTATFTVRASNLGFTELSDVTVVVHVSLVELLGVSGDGWTCEPVTGTGAMLPAAVCHRPSLAVGASSSLSVVVRTAEEATYAELRAFGGMANATDTEPTNNPSTAFFAIAPDIETLEHILIPIVSAEAPGAFGSIWKSELWAGVTPGPDVTIYPLIEPCQILCPPPPPGLHLAGGTIQRLNVPLPTVPPALMLYVAMSDRDRIDFNLRIQDISRQAETWGTEIPVVRGEELENDRVLLLNVPLDERFRQMLRVYDPDARMGASVLVRFFVNGLLDPVAQTVETLFVPADNDWAFIGYPSQPGYVQMGDFRSRFPELAAAERVTIEILPMEQDQKLWAFVSVTNNETQHVTTITPQ